jgi:hypothetical protein
MEEVPIYRLVFIRLIYTVSYLPYTLFFCVVKGPAADATDARFSV